MQENFYSDINLAGNKLLNAQISLETVESLPLNTPTELIQLGRTVVYQNQLYRYTRLVTDVDLAEYTETEDPMAPSGYYTVQTTGQVKIHSSLGEPWELYADWVPISAGQEKFDELESKIDDVQMGIKHLKPVDYFATLERSHLTQSYKSLADIHQKCGVFSKWEETILLKGEADLDEVLIIPSSDNNRMFVKVPYSDPDGKENAGAVYIYDYNSDTNEWTETKITASDGAENDNFGNHIEITDDSNRMFVKVPNSCPDGNKQYAGAVYIYDYNSGTSSWYETKITASDGAAQDYFGHYTKLTDDGNRMFVGVRNSDPGGERDAGAIYIYDYNSDTNEWIETKITSSDGVENEYFGTTIELKNDGNRMFVKSPYSDPDGKQYAGAVYIYDYNSNTNEWVETKITASDGAVQDYFGEYIKLTDDGNRMFVRAHYSDPDGEENAGAVYIYDYNSDTNEWTETKITASDGAAHDRFGRYIEITNAGNRMFVGVRNSDPDGKQYAGAVYIYDYNSDTNEWVETKITASDGAVQDYFGENIELTDDGNRMFVKVPHSDPDGKESAGAVYIYDYNSITNEWVETKITASDGAKDDSFGRYIEITNAGNRMFVRVHYSDPDGNQNVGAVYIYDYNSNTNEWVETKITASDGAENDYFGENIELTDDGNRMFVKVLHSDPDGKENAGAVYIYDYNSGTSSWYETKITASDGAAQDYFGGYIEITDDGNRMFVKVQNSDPDGNQNVGAVYIYDYDSITNEWIETKITASNGVAGDRFGNYTKLTDAGNRLFVNSSYGIYAFELTNPPENASRIKLSNGFSFAEIATAKGFSSFTPNTPYPYIEAFIIGGVDEHTATIKLIDLQVGDRILEKTSGIWEIVKISDTDYRFARPTDFPITNIDRTKYNGAYVFVQKGSPDVSADTGFIQAVENTADGGLGFEFVPYGTSPGMVKNLIDDTRRYANDLSEARDLFDKLDNKFVFHGADPIPLAALEQINKNFTNYDPDSFQWIKFNSDSTAQDYISEALTLIKTGPGIQMVFDIEDEDGTNMNKYFEYKAPTWEELREMNKEVIKTVVTAIDTRVTGDSFDNAWNKMIENGSSIMVDDDDVNYDCYKAPVFIGKINIPKEEFIVVLKNGAYKLTKDYILEHMEQSGNYMPRHFFGLMSGAGLLAAQLFRHKISGTDFTNKNLWGNIPPDDGGLSFPLWVSNKDVPEVWGNLKKRKYNIDLTEGESSNSGVGIG